MPVRLTEDKLHITGGGKHKTIALAVIDPLRETEEEKKLEKKFQEDDQRIYATNVFQALRFYRVFMYVCLRFPVYATTTSEGYKYYTSASHPVTIGYLVLSVFLGILGVLLCINLFGIILNCPSQPEEHNGRPRDILRIEELYLFKRNIIPCIVLSTSLLHVIIANYSFWNKKDFAASYLTFWTEAVEILRIDVAHGMTRYMRILMVSYGVYLLILFFMCGLQFAPLSSGAPTLMAMMIFRIFIPQIHASKVFFLFRGIAGFIFFYILICAKSFVFIFLYKCKLLKNAFVVWNHRLDRVLHRGEAARSRVDKISNRTGFDHLFKDHVCLLDLIDGTDTLFANIIETYIGTQIISICFEVYYLYRTQSSSKEFVGVRRLDGIILFFYTLHTIILLSLSTTAAADVGDEAMNGLEIIRRKGMLGKKTDEELYFMLSLFISFTGHNETALSGGKYFVLDKGFLVAVTGTVFSYFIILIQFTPALVLRPEDNYQVRLIDPKRLLDEVEGTHDYFSLEP